MRRILLCASLVILLAPSAHAALPGDSAGGKRLHDANCTGCHDTGVYTRKDRRVRSLDALKQQLEGCNHAARGDFSAKETQHILEYLNEKFYRFSGKSAGFPTPAPAPQAVRTPGAAAHSPALSAAAPKDVERAQPMQQGLRAAEKQEEIQALYDTARKIRSVVARDKAYATLVDYATRDGDFELATDIAGRMSSDADRDGNYSKIVYQATLARDFPAADKAARKVSSVALRNEQFKRITDSCPSTATTQ